MASRWLKMVQWGGGLVIVVFVSRHLIRNWAEVANADLAWNIDLSRLLLGLLLVLAGFWVLSGAWRSMVSSWGYHLLWWTATRIWLLSSMGKYIPGKIWAVAGMAVMAKKEGVPPWASTGSAIILQILALSTGALVVAATGSGMLNGAGDPRLQGPVFLLVGGGSLLLVLLALWPPFLTRVTQLLAQQPMHHTPSNWVIGVALGANVSAWLAYGTAFWLFASGTLPGVTLSLPQAIAASTAAYVVGVLTPFAPGGLGVREGIMVVALRSQTGLGEALALAAVARIGMTVAEVGAAAPFLLRGGKTVD